MNAILRFVLSSILLGAGAASAIGQSLPTSQPAVLGIQIEEVKVGHGAEHVATERGWPEALEKAKSAFPYLALASMSGRPEVWFVTPYDSHAKAAESAEEGGEALAAELARLSRADAEHLTGMRNIHAVARKDLSHGAYPDTARQRFFEITAFRVRPGGEGAFEAAAKAYGAAAGRAAPGVAYRVYEVVAGMPSPTYLVFGSVVSFGDFDKVMADGAATMKAMTPEEQDAMQKFPPHAVSIETNRYRVDPDMSFVPQSIRDQDPTFWK